MLVFSLRLFICTHFLTGRRILHAWIHRAAGGSQANSRVLATQVGFIRTHAEKVLTVASGLIFRNRAQKRIMQQRLDSRMELGRIVDIRKKVFNEVKVSALDDIRMPLLM